LIQIISPFKFSHSSSDFSQGEECTFKAVAQRRARSIFQNLPLPLCVAADGGVAPDAQHVIAEVDGAHHEGDDKEHLGRLPAGRLLMPEARDEAQDRERQAQGVEHRLALAMAQALLEMRVMNAVERIDIQADHHPDDEPDPCVGGQEDHEAEAGEDAEHRDERHKGHTEGALHIGHRLAQDDDGGAHQREGQQRADTGHLARHLGRHDGGQQCHSHHEQQIAVRRRAEARMDAREERRQQSVAAHGEEHTALGHERHHDDRAVAHEDGERHGGVEPRIGGVKHARGVRGADVTDGHRHGSDALETAELVVVRHAGHHVAERYVEHRDHQQRAQDTDRHVATRIAALLGRRTHRVKAEKREGHHGSAPEDAGEAELAQLARVRRDEGVQIVRVDVLPAEDHEHDDHAYLERHDDIVDDGTALHAADEEQAHHHHDGGGGQIDHASVPRAGGQRWRQEDAHVLEEDHKIAAPADAHRRGGHRVFEHQVPAYDPGHELAHGGVGIRVGRTGDGDDGGKLGVAERGEAAAHRGQQEGEDNGGPGIVGRHCAGDGE